MSLSVRRFVVFALAILVVGYAEAEPLVLKASKDTFGKSSDYNRNSGASQTLYVAQASVVRSLVAFDLSVVTNRIVTAAFRFQQQSSNEHAVDLVVAPMVQTKHNAAWGEGTGSMGVAGQTAQPGEACYGWSAYPSVQWELASGGTVAWMGDEHLWNKPLASLKALSWKADEWVEIKITDIQWLEDIRQSDSPTVTFGLWGTSGTGYYAISSKESGKAPELVLTLDEKKEATKTINPTEPVKAPMLIL